MSKRSKQKDESATVHEAAQRILDLTRHNGDLVKSAEFFQVLHDLYQAGKAEGPALEAHR